MRRTRIRQARQAHETSSWGPRIASLIRPRACLVGSHACAPGRFFPQSSPFAVRPGAQARQAHETSSWGPRIASLSAHELASWVHIACAPGGFFPQSSPFAVRPGAQARQAHESSSWGPRIASLSAHELASWVHIACAPGGFFRNRPRLPFALAHRPGKPTRRARGGHASPHYPPTSLPRGFTSPVPHRRLFSAIVPVCRSPWHQARQAHETSSWGPRIRLIIRPRACLVGSHRLCARRLFSAIVAVCRSSWRTGPASPRDELVGATHSPHYPPTSLPRGFTARCPPGRFFSHSSPIAVRPVQRPGKPTSRARGGRIGCCGA